ncbi:MAG: glutamate 5-kinase [Pseudomonadota bacterium]
MTQALRLDAFGRIVIKIGSALVADDASALRSDWIAALAADVARLTQGGQDVIIVSSGAIALGGASLGVNGRPSRLDEAQAAACVGQITLMNAYRTAFNDHGKQIGQLLLTLSDLDGRRSYLNARAALDTLLERGIVPVVNENDATATEEIRVGDNDRLAARVAQMTDADLLILLSDVDGLYTANPAQNKEAQHIAQVDSITPDVLALADTPDPAAMSRGGMLTKLQAGQIATSSGCQMVIMNGAEIAPLSRLEQGERHSVFRTSQSRRQDARRRWLSGQLGAQGAIAVDAGAHKALLSGKSLLAAGIVSTKGRFTRGDVVSLLGPDGSALGHGLSNYDSAEIDLIAGLKSDDITAKLGYTRSQTVVHRDNLVLKQEGSDT